MQRVYKVLYVKEHECLEKHDVHVSFTVTDWKIIWVNAVNQEGNDLDFAFHIIKNGILVMQELPLDLPVS